MKPMNRKDRVKTRRTEALDRRLKDITTLEGGEIPGLAHTPQPGEARHTTAARIIQDKLARANTDVENLKRKVS